MPYSKSAYERQLKKWNLGKNVKSSHVKFLKVKIQKQEKQKDDFLVVVGGVQLSRFEIEKKAARCHLSTIDRFERKLILLPKKISLV